MRPRKLSIEKESKQITITAHRYKLYLQEKRQLQIVKSNRSNNFMSCLTFLERKARKIWMRCIPRAIRGCMSQYQVFQEAFQAQFKDQILEVIEKRSIEEVLYEPQSIIFGVIYSEKLMKETKLIIDSLERKNLGEDSKIRVCPLNSGGQLYQKSYLPVVGQLDAGVVILWRGLFDELQVLGYFTLKDSNILEKACDLISEKRRYELKINEELRISEEELIIGNESSHDNSNKVIHIQVDG